MNDYRDHITIDPGKRGGKPCIRSMRITVYDVLDWLASGLSESQILEDYPELTQNDIRACLAFAANRERQPNNKLFLDMQVDQLETSFISYLTARPS